MEHTPADGLALPRTAPPVPEGARACRTVPAAGSDGAGRRVECRTIRPARADRATDAGGSVRPVPSGAPAARGDIAVRVTINGATDPHVVAREAEAAVDLVLGRYESDRWAMLSE
jgi:hypothetical protein